MKQKNTSPRAALVVIIIIIIIIIIVAAVIIEIIVVQSILVSKHSPCRSALRPRHRGPSTSYESTPGGTHMVNNATTYY